MNVLNTSQKSLRADLVAAFPPDPPPAARDVLDLFIHTQEAYDLFPKVAGVRWTDLELPWSYTEDLIYLLPHAYRYYFPAHIHIALVDPAKWSNEGYGAMAMNRLQPIWPSQSQSEAQLRREFRAEFSWLTSLQRQAVVRVLRWMLQQQDQDEEFPALDEESIASFWEDEVESR